MGERKEDVGYWLFMHEQSTNIFNHGNLAGRGCGLSLQSFLSEQWKKRSNSLEKCFGLGVGSATQYRRVETSSVERKMTLSMEVWGGRQYVDHIPDLEITFGILFLPGVTCFSRNPRSPRATGLCAEQDNSKHQGPNSPEPTLGALGHLHMMTGV